MKSPYHYETNYTRSVNATGFDRFLQVSQKVTCFFWYYLPPPSKQYFIWKLFHPLSKAHSFDILNYSYLKKSNNTFAESENIELNITATDSRIILYFSRYDLFNKHKFQTLAKRTRCDATTTQKLCLKIANAFLDREYRPKVNGNILIL